MRGGFGGANVDCRSSRHNPTHPWPAYRAAISALARLNQVSLQHGKHAVDIDRNMRRWLLFSELGCAILDAHFLYGKMLRKGFCGDLCQDLVGHSHHFIKPPQKQVRYGSFLSTLRKLTVFYSCSRAPPNLSCRISPHCVYRVSKSHHDIPFHCECSTRRT